MSTRKFCLAILSNGEATGYEIRKIAQEGRFSHFIDASYGSIYPGLAKLETEGLVTWREESTAGKPTRKVYSITEAGREEFVKELRETPVEDFFRSSFLLLAHYCQWVGEDFIKDEIDRRIEHIQTQLNDLKELRQEVDESGSLWTIDYGIAMETASLEYLTTNRSRLEAIAREPVQHRQAAE